MLLDIIFFFGNFIPVKAFILYDPNPAPIVRLFNDIQHVMSQEPHGVWDIHRRSGAVPDSEVVHYTKKLFIVVAFWLSCYFIWVKDWSVRLMWRFSLGLSLCLVYHNICDPSFVSLWESFKPLLLFPFIMFYYVWTDKARAILKKIFRIKKQIHVAKQKHWFFAIKNIINLFFRNIKSIKKKKK